MPLAGKGMLLTSMDIDPSDEAEFNRWYDREHLEERVAIDGFLEARRYIAHNAKPKYLCLYSTATSEVLDSAAYRAKLANPTDWSKKTMARFKNRAAVQRSASSACGLKPAAKTHCALACARSSIRRSSTASSPCICWRAIPNYPGRRPKFLRRQAPAPATGSC